MNEKIAIREERLSAEEYIDFLKRTDLGSQYPKERFESRIAKLVNTVSISLVAGMPRWATHAYTLYKIQN